MARALHQALADLSEKLGRNPEGWRLDKLKSATFLNVVGSNVPLLSRLFTRRVFLSGDSFTVRVSSGPYATPFETKVIQSYLGLFDMGNQDSRLIIPMGQSGHPLSKYYDDLLSPWRDTVLLQMQQRKNEHELILSPVTGAL